MAIQTINTRIKNKVDLFNNWQASTSTLLDGEIAIVRFLTGGTYVNPVTGKDEPECEMLMKIGNGTSAFADLPWLSAKASDVYDWAKVQDPSTISVTYNGETSTLANVLKDVKAASAAVSSKLSDITVTQSGTGVVKSVTKGATGTVTVSRDTVATSEIADAAVTTAKIADSAVTDAKIAKVAASKVEVTAAAGETAAVMLPAKLSAIDGEISSIKSAIAGGTHFVGTTTTALSDGATTKPVTVNSKNHTPAAGDIVLYDNKEFIWTGSAWEELGDLTRVGALETWRGKLVKADAAEANKFVTKVDIAADGTVTIGREQPTSANVKHGDSDTVSSVLIDHTSKLTGLTNSTVQESINAKINALDLTTDPTSGGEADSTENFVTQVRQADGKVSYSRKTLPKASTSKVGIVQLADGTSSSDATKAATAASTKSAYDKAVNAQGRISTVEGNYVRFANDKLYVGLTGADEIIFDCGTSANL